MIRPCIAVLAWLPEGRFEQLASAHPEFEFLDARTAEGLRQHLAGPMDTFAWVQRLDRTATGQRQVPGR